MTLLPRQHITGRVMTNLKEEADAGRIGIVDIGSNSVRLVIYDVSGRTQDAVFNDKALCGIGRNMVSSGRLDDKGMEEAIKALARFKLVAQSHKVRQIEAVATAAVRDASNGNQFAAMAREALGAPIKVLTGEEEARFAAEGVVAAIPDADGIVGDLGGGSLELMPVRARVAGAGQSLPVGPLRLMDAAGSKVDRARAIVDEHLTQLTGIESMRGKTLYAVGGVWRALARIHMQRVKHPIKILHQYMMGRDEALSLSQHVTGLSRRALEDITEISRKRAETLPFGAVVMERLLRVAKMDRVVVSAYGLREGVLMSRLSDGRKSSDPLLEHGRAVAERQAQDPGLDSALMQWTQAIAQPESEEERRLRHAVCLLADIGWRGHPDHRATTVFEHALNGQYFGADHRARAFIAMALFYRYQGDEKAPEAHDRIQGLLGPDASIRALILGLALRLALSMAGPVRSVIEATSLKVTATAVVLHLPPSYQALESESAIKRLVELAEVIGKTPRIDAKAV